MPDRPASPVDNLPFITLLCMEQKFITTFNQALETYWPTHATSPKIRIVVVNTSLRNVPEDHKFQLVVSPANSYGRLDGAFDDAISREFCLPHHSYDTLTHAVQDSLYEKWRGFAPPGSCTLVEFPRELEGTNKWGCKWVAICPTMRTPDNVRWDREVVYECVWSLMSEVEAWNRRVSVQSSRIESILMTPLATGCGAVSPQKWASQLVLALVHYVDALERPERWKRLGWKEIYEDTDDVQKTWVM